jgi:hypothetical protein
MGTEMRVSLHVNCPLILSDFNENLNVLIKHLGIKFRENLFGDTCFVFHAHTWTVREQF